MRNLIDTFLEILDDPVVHIITAFCAATIIIALCTYGIVMLVNGRF